MSEQTEQKIPKGSYAAGHRVELPRGATEPMVVYINGVAQTAGIDYNVEGNYIVFTRQIIKEIVGKVQWFIMFIGLVGSYGVDETVDVQYTVEGKPDLSELASELKVIPDDDTQVH